MSADVAWVDDWERAQAARADDHFDQALELCRTALVQIDRDAWPAAWAHAQSMLGDLLSRPRPERSSRDLRAATEAYRCSLEVFTQEKRPTNWATAMHSLGRVLQRVDGPDAEERIDEAIATLKAAQSVGSRQTTPEEWAAIEYQLGLAYERRGRGDRSDNLRLALEHFRSSIEVRTKSSQPFAWARTQFQIARCLHQASWGSRSENIEAAIEALTGAAVVLTREERPKEWAKVQHNLGAAYSKRILGDRADNVEQSIEHYEVALLVRTRESDPSGWAMTKQNLGIAFGERVEGTRADNLEEAIGCYEQALEIRQHSEARRDWAVTQHNLGTAYHDRLQGDRAENLERAIAAYRAALRARRRSTEPWQWATTQQDLGLAYSKRMRGSRQQNLRNAVTCCRKAVAVFDRERSPEDWASAQEYLGRVLALRPRGGAEAARSYGYALGVYAENEYPRDFVRLNALLGSLLRRTGRPDEALRCYRKALDLSGEAIGASHTRSGQEEQAAQCAVLAREAVELGLELALPGAEVLELSELGRARILRNQLALQQAAPREIEDEHARQEAALIAKGRRLEAAREVEQARSQRNKIAGELAAVRRALDEVWEKIERDGVGLYADLRRGRSPSWSEVHRWLAQQEHDTGFVSLIVVDSGIAVAVGRDESTEPVWLSLEISLHALRSWIETFDREVRQARIPGLDQETWLEAGAALAKPILDVIGDAEVVYLVPHSDLHGLPFHALLNRPDRTRPRVFSYAPSIATAMQITTDSNVSLGQPVVVGDPIEDLAGARKEAIAVSRQLGTEPLLGSAATKEAVVSKLRRSPAVAHFAGHASFVADDPLASGLVLADGMLTASELMALNVNSELFFLSACESGRHRALAGEELLGVGNALLLAGVRTVVASLWPVDDREAAVQASELYGCLRDETPIGRAVSVVQESARRRNPHTSLWGPLVVIGDPNARPSLGLGPERASSSSK